MFHVLLACTWFFYAAPICIVGLSWRARVLSAEEDGLSAPPSLCSILLVPQNKSVITLSMMFMGFSAMLYEILYFDETTMASIAGLLAAIFGLLHSSEKSGVHCVFATGAFICILHFSCCVAVTHYYSTILPILHGILMCIASTIVLFPTSPNFCILETLFIIVFAVVYNIRHFQSAVVAM